ncbi:UNVERIFIED_CONTAM: hypothetical protein FKN15_025842 [Acipenser sinensis]
MAANMYRVGEHTFHNNIYDRTVARADWYSRGLLHTCMCFVTTANGNVEAKVVCFYRRRDIPSNLIALADKHSKELEEEIEGESLQQLTEKQIHQLRHRELFLSRQLESLPATHIRWSCTSPVIWRIKLSPPLNQDGFFYCLVYDPQQKTLLADKGEIRIGPRFQADITDLMKEDETDDRDQTELETKIWEPESPLTDEQIDQFLVITRSVGTFARALDCSSSIRQHSLHMSAAAASRDITLFHAMDTLHRCSYDMSCAITALVPQGGPVLCRDEMEEWSASEANLFEEALEKYGKDFIDIRQDFLPWKSLTSIVEYYYMWKTTDRYVQQKRLKAAEAESRLKQVYIPNYNKPNPNQIGGNSVKTNLVNGSGSQGQNSSVGRACESCYSTQCSQWYSWGPPSMQCRLCSTCWNYWKKYGGLKMPRRLEGERLGPNRNSMSPFGYWVKNANPKYTLKTKQAFYLQTTTLTKIARQLCLTLLQPRRAARRPFVLVNSAEIKAQCSATLPDEAKQLVKMRPMVRKPLETIVKYMELHPYIKPEPVKSTMSLIPHKRSASVAKVVPVINYGSTTILGKRSYEQHNGAEGQCLGLPNHSQVRQLASLNKSYLLNGKTYERPQRMMKHGSLPPLKDRRMNWIDAPDDVFFMANEDTRKVRKLLASFDVKRAARQPYKQIFIKHIESELDVPAQLRHPVNEEPIIIED